MTGIRVVPHDPIAALTDRMIMQQIGEGARVVDLGCGDGRLLCRLRDERHASILGIELDWQHVLDSIAKGVPVIRSDLDEGLHDLADHSFDYAVLSQTLQQVRRPKEMLQEMLRVAKRAIVVVPNYGHWRIRWNILRRGRAPVTSTLPYDWYNTPNLHFLSMLDFRELATRLGVKIVLEAPIIRGTPRAGAWAANLRADMALYVLESQAP